MVPRGSGSEDSRGVAMTESSSRAETLRKKLRLRPDKCGPEELRAWRHLLRHSEHARALRINPVAVQLIAAWYPRGVNFVSDSDLLRIIREIISPTFSSLTPRQRQIIARCDVGGERCSDVAIDLSISTRHLIREHNSAIKIIARHLGTPTQNAPRVLSDSSDTINAYMVLSSALEQSGHFESGIEVLARLANQVSNVEVRTAIEIRLAEIYIDANQLSYARDHIHAALRLSSAALDPDTTRAKVAICEALLAMAMGNATLAFKKISRSCLMLRSAYPIKRDIETEDSLIKALNLRSEWALLGADFTTASKLSREAGLLLEHRGDATSKFAICSKNNAGVLHVLQGDFATGEAELRECLRDRA